MKLLKEETLNSLYYKLQEKTGCSAQHTGWSCNSCFHNMTIDLKEDIHQYWLAVLSFRGDYLDYNWDKEGIDTSNFAKLIEELNNKL